MKLSIKALKDLVLGRRYNLREIVRYETDRDDWICVSKPTEGYISKVSRYAGKEVIRKAISFFEGGKNCAV